MVFSQKQTAIDTLNCHIRRAKTMAKSGINIDFKTAHPDEVRDAQKKDFTTLIKRVTDLHNKRYKQALDRRLKLVGKREA